MDKLTSTGEHIWISTRVSGDFCYVGEVYCSKSGSRLKCSACKIVVHESCTDILLRSLSFNCKPTFIDIPTRSSEIGNFVQHHWVRSHSEKKKCKHCMKNIENNMLFGNKDPVAIRCSWCKIAYHNKESCFSIQKVDEECDLGSFRNIIVPPNWICQIPPKRNTRQSKEAVSNNKELPKETKSSSFVIKPNRDTDMKPLIIFINPRSGGNQGVKILQEFQFLLNPKQVFDLTQGGPNYGLKLYKKVKNLRVLACGGDGTVGWILSVIDQLKIVPCPAVGVLPLGTGNDLARTLGWGGGYTNEPVREILLDIEQSHAILLDRWKMEVEKNFNVEPDEKGNDRLPLDVMNNYFSMGVDANIALDFHEAREAHPEKFNSRIKNKMFYGQLGGKDLLLRKWKSLSDYIEIECDGTDFSQKLRDLKVHAIVFLNITSYGGGTKPWDKTAGASKPSMEDGYLEVIGLTTYQLPLLQAGGHGTCITQCKSAKIVTSKTIPMQVDGEACKVNPSVITVSLMNKATLLAQKVRNKPRHIERSYDNFEITVLHLKEPLFNESADINVLMESAHRLHKFELEYSCNLENLRMEISKFLEENRNVLLSNEWFFIDSINVKEGLSRIDTEEEQFQFVSDVAEDNILIIVTGNATTCGPEKNKFDDDTVKIQDEVVKTPATIPKCNKKTKRESNDNKCNKVDNSKLKTPPEIKHLILHTDRKSMADRLLVISDSLRIHPRYPMDCVRKSLDSIFARHEAKMLK